MSVFFDSKREITESTPILGFFNFIVLQQLQSTVMGNESARRYFEAVQGHGDHKGELFGIKNLFRMQVNGTCLTRKILEVRMLSWSD